MKKTIRNEIKTTLAGLSAEDIRHRSMIIEARLCTTEAFDRASTIMLYLPFAGEVQTLAIARRAWAEGKTVCVPTSPKDRNMQPVTVKEGDEELFDPTHCLRSPIGEALDISDIDFIVVPALAYDRKCNRLGRGGGFYDRFLSEEKLKAYLAGVAFTEQIRDDLPIEPNDRPVHSVFTDTKIITNESAEI